MTHRISKKNYFFKGSALKCYICESYSNPGCVDLNDTRIQPQDCVIESLDNRSITLIGAKQDNVRRTIQPPTCLKIVTYDGEIKFQSHCCDRIERLYFQSNLGDREVVHRRCTTIYKNEDGCEYTTPSEFCDTCESDGCNSGNSIQLSTLIVFGAMACTAIRFVV